MLLPATPGWVSLPVVVGGPRHSWLRVPGAVPRHSWLGPAGGGGAWCVVCGVRRWCVGGVVAGVWCGWSLATPGGGSCVLLPATPGWVSLPVVVGGPRHSWLRVPGAVPRHSWLGSVGGGVWRGRSLATPGGGSCVLLPATPGWVSVPVVVCGPPPLLAGVRWRPWCVVCGVWCVVCGVWCVVCGVWRAAVACVVGLWLVCGVVGPSPLVAEAPVCYSPPLLAGFRCRRWWAFLATPGGGSRARFLATPGWVSLSAVVCGVWCVVCGVWRAAVACVVGLWLVCGVVGPSPLLAEVPVCYSPPLLAGFRCRRWWAFLATPGGASRARFPATPGWVSLSAVVCGVWCVVCGVWCAAVACVVGMWLVCGVVGPSPLLAEVPVCYSPPLLAGFRCRWWCGAPRHSWLEPAGCGGVFRGRGCPLLCVFVVFVGVRGGRAVLCVVCLWCLCFWWCGVVVVGVSSGCPSPWPWCVCVRCVALRVGVGGVGGGVVRGVAVVRARVCARGVWLVGWGVSYLGWFSSSVVGMFQKAEEEVL